MRPRWQERWERTPTGPVPLHHTSTAAHDVGALRMRFYIRALFQHSLIGSVPGSYLHVTAG